MVPSALTMASGWHATENAARPQMQAERHNAGRSSDASTAISTNDQIA
jgi:hypothetical protein